MSANQFLSPDRFAGRVAIVTGGGQGIGEATARRLAAEGAAVAILDRQAERAEAVASDLRASGTRTAAIVADVANAAEVERAVADVVNALGPPDVLVNNAGIAVFDEPLSLTADDWRRCFAVDLDGVWHCTKAVLPHFLRAGRGSVVNVASVHSFQIIPHTFPYPVAKHAVIGLTRALAVEYGRQGIRVNAVCPSYVDTQIVRDFLEASADPAAARSHIEALHPVGRIANTDEVAAAIAFLASDECRFITGASLMVDGGRSVLYHE
jgi:NAD(P)-dependent dehydrogenase (short-subunit alcohol dehydrogenase family)